MEEFFKIICQNCGSSDIKLGVELNEQFGEVPYLECRSCRDMYVNYYPEEEV